MDNAELIKALRYCSDNEREEGCDECPYLHNGMCHTMLSDAAYALEARLPKEGEWIHGRELGKEWLYDHWVAYFEDWRCSNCGIVFEQESKPKYHYCPNCGARMKGEQE